MLNEQPNNIVQKINLIKDNINPENKVRSSAFVPFDPKKMYNFTNTNQNYGVNFVSSDNKEENMERPQFNLIKSSPTTSSTYTALNQKLQTKKIINISVAVNDDSTVEKNDKCIDSENKNNQAVVQNDEAKKKRRRNKFKIRHLESKVFYIAKKCGKFSNKLTNKLKHKRKYKPDDIRKKIKARFHKSIKNIINENLKRAGSKKLFTFLPQIFISSISREKNSRVLDLSLRELLATNFISEENNEKLSGCKNVDLAKYKKNVSVLKYLDENPEISRASGFDLISNMKYCDLLEEYFQSNEFETAICKLKDENEDEEYIKEYIKKSKTYVKFFRKIPNKTKPEIFKITSENLPD